MMLFSAATSVSEISPADAVASFGVVRQKGVNLRRMDNTAPAHPAPSAVVVLAHGFPFSAIAQNVADRDEQQKADKRSNNQKDFQGFLLKSGSNQNV